LFIKGNKI